MTCSTRASPINGDGFPADRFFRPLKGETHERLFAAAA